MAHVPLFPIGNPREAVVDDVEFDRELSGHAPLVRKLEDRRREVQMGWGGKYVERVHEKDKLTTRERLDRLKEVELTYSLAQAQEEAARCMVCGGCEICWEICPFDAIRMENGVAVSDPDKCDGCNMCVMACPVDAPTLKNEEIPMLRFLA